MRERKKIVTAKSLGIIALTKDYVPPLDSTLDEMKDWTKNKALELYDQVVTFKNQIMHLCQNESYLDWIQVTGQKELALEWGVSQPTVSRLVGDIQKDYKNSIKVQVTELYHKGKSIKDIQIDIPLALDERTIRRWVSSDNGLLIDAEYTDVKEDNDSNNGLEQLLRLEKSKRKKAEKEVEELKIEVLKWKNKYNELRTKYSGE